MDWLLVVLAIIIVLIFIAIFTLLKTMHSPYIMRFEAILQGKFEKLDQVPGCYQITFNHDGHKGELLEVQYQAAQNQKTVYNNFLFLRIETSSKLSLRLVDVFTESKIRFILDDVFKFSQDKTSFILPNMHLDEVFKEFRIMTNDTMLAKNFLMDSDVIETFKLFKARLGTVGFVMPLMVSRGVVTLDYSISEACLNELTSNSRYLNKHIELLSQLASRLSSIK